MLPRINSGLILAINAVSAIARANLGNSRCARAGPCRCNFLISSISIRQQDRSIGSERKRQRNMKQCDELDQCLGQLTAKQIEVLELLLQHNSSKEIARTLAISPYTVDQRIAAARKKLGASSRAELARAYLQSRSIYGYSVYGSPYVDETLASEQSPTQAVPADPVFMISDAAPMIFSEAPWHEHPVALGRLETLDRRFGILGRIGAIVGLAAILAMLLLTVLAAAEALSRLI